MLVGYWGKADETVRAFRNLWWHTGDAGYVDGDGFFYFVDRKKDVIRRRGENISSFELEAMLNSHPAVLESAAFGVPSELGEEDVKMVVVFKPDHSAPFDELAEFLADRLPRFAVPRYLEARDALPKTPSERVQKHLLKAAGITPATWDREWRS
jgi:crotonobetaine/carnitine-CoA ligase